MPDHQTSPVGEDAERALDYLLAAAQSVVNDALDAAEEGIHPCDINNEERKAEHMPMPMQSLHYAIRIAWRAVDKQAARRAAPALDASGLPPPAMYVSARQILSVSNLVEDGPGYINCMARKAPRNVCSEPLYTTEQVRQAQRDAVAADRRKQAALTELVEQAQELDMGYGAPTQPKAQVGTIEDYAQFHILHGAWMSAREYWQDDAAEQVAEAWRKFIAYIDAWAGSRAGDAVRDAERYQYLRNAAWFKEGFAMTEPNASSFQYMGELLDSKVDAARKAAPGKQAGNDQDAAV